jgi:hypothetical protein|tara:strand:+ start:110 stop:685 length:576 start_codon:yes stop_codon:yes gene_type:complete
MLYTYSKQKLDFTNVTRKVVIGILGYTFFLILSTFLLTHNSDRREVIETITLEERMVVINENNTKFSSDTLIYMLKELNVKFPHIVLAQSIVETGHWTSKIFLENNNLFGMKEAYVRVHTAKGTQYGHAYYENWEESVYDYAFYQCRYLGAIRTEDEYFNYLSNSYAEAPNYIKILKQVIVDEKLREKFQK